MHSFRFFYALIGGVLLLLTLQSQAREVEISSKKFEMYYQMTRHNLGHAVATLDALGLTPIRLSYHGRFGIKQERSRRTKEHEPLSRTALMNAAEAIRRDGNYAPENFTVLDIEIWKTGVEVDEMTALENVRNYLGVIRTLKELLPGRELGNYGLPVSRNYLASIRGRDSEPYKQWQARNDMMTELANELDIFLPSLYTFQYEARDEWAAYARAHIEECRRLAKRGQRVVVFLWPYYHDRSKSRGRPIGDEFWKFQLTLVRDLADGVFIWSNHEGAITADVPWIVVLQSFIQESRALGFKIGGE